MRMSTAQQIIIFFTIVIIFFMGVYPPVGRQASRTNDTLVHKGYSLITSVNIHTQYKALSINTTLLLVQWLGVILVASGAFVIATFPRKKDVFIIEDNSTSKKPG